MTGQRGGGDTTLPGLATWSIEAAFEVSKRGGGMSRLFERCVIPGALLDKASSGARDMRRTKWVGYQGPRTG